ncbi:MAG: DUF1566 domain-containing protein [Magnetococcales bacterium]|nr:DUF1566 domain-containing protein [Magnetococcales bacterium]MBF0151327.1 DUF1566 domain-containing protein [Magnetococcales bacterium]
MFFFIIAIIALPLSGCGGDGTTIKSKTTSESKNTATVSGTSTSTTSSSDKVSGVAAAGAPMVGQAWLKDSTGKQIGPSTIAADGGFSFDVAGLAAPFYLAAKGNVGGQSYTLYSATTSMGTANINPLTNLAVAAAAGVNDPSLAYGSLDGKSIPIPITQATLESAIKDVKTMLAPLLNSYQADVDPLKDSFTANRSGLDAVFDVVKVSINASNGNVSLVDRSNNKEIVSAEVTKLRTAKAMDSAAVPSKQIISDLTAIAKIIEKMIPILNYVNSEAKDYEPFFSENFGMHNGRNRKQEIDEWISGGPPQSIKEITNLMVVKTMAPGTFMIGFTVSYANDTKEPVVMSQPWVNEGTKEAPAWKMIGNGYKFDMDLQVESHIWDTASTANSTPVSGLKFWAEDPGSMGIGSFLIKGPGLPTEGLSLVQNPNQANSFMIDEKLRTKNIPNSGNFYPLDDAVISGIKDGAEYTVTAYGVNSTTIGTATYWTDKAPVTLAEINKIGISNFFPTIDFKNAKGVSSHNLSDMVDGATITFTYGFPKTTAYIIDRLESSAGIWCDNNSYWAEGEGLSRNKTSASITLPGRAWTPCGGELNVKANGYTTWRVIRHWMFEKDPVVSQATTNLSTVTSESSSTSGAEIKTDTAKANTVKTETLSSQPVSSSVTTSASSTVSTSTAASSTSSGQTVSLSSVQKSAVTIGDVTTTEGDSGPVTANFVVTLDKANSQAVKVDYVTSTVTSTADPAEANVDYTTTTGTLTIPVGQTSGTIAVPVLGDVLDEANEMFRITLSNPVNATLADAQGDATIVDNDPEPSVAFTLASQSVQEGVLVTVTVQLSSVSGAQVKVPFTTSGTATSGFDYHKLTVSPIAITPGSLSGNVSFRAALDDVVDDAETVILTLGEPTHATKGSTAIHTVTLSNVLQVPIVPKTGQTISYSPFDDGVHQAGISWPVPRFTDNQDGTVSDGLTGLIWLKNADCFGLQSWSSALSLANALVSGSCGLSDGSTSGSWRLPNRREFKSLIDYGRFSPALSNAHPFSDVRLDVYWSSSTYGGTTNAWNMNLISGVLSYSGRTDSRHVWPVRGGN